MITQEQLERILSNQILILDSLYFAPFISNVQELKADIELAIRQTIEIRSEIK